MRVPIATYRLQFNPAFGFKQAKAILPYLTKLGISDIYASPIFKARKNSLHGYDITDPNQLNPELGSSSDFNNLMTSVKNYGMGWLQDIVPNHTAYDCENCMLSDVLENGKNSEYADFFDIRWDFTFDKFDGKILAPFLGKPYHKALEEGEITLEYDKGQIWTCYYEKKFPLRLKCYKEVLLPNFQHLESKLGKNHPSLPELTGHFEALSNLEDLGPANGRRERVLNTKKKLWDLYKTNPKIKRCFDENIVSSNKNDKTSDNLQYLDKILSNQFYRFVYWRETKKIINYRRFFYLDDFIALKIENENVFDHTHRLIFHFIEKMLFTGLRIDHVDGLYDPSGYLHKIREKAGNVYITIEKILALDEKLRNDWPVQGTTGYDFLNFLNGVFCNSGTESKFTQLYQKIAGSRSCYGDLLCKKKKIIIEKYMPGDLDYLLYLLKKITDKNNPGNAATISKLRNVLVEILAHFPVYRTYLTAPTQDEKEISYIQEAIAKAKENISNYQQEYKIISRIFLGPYNNTEDDKRELIARFVSQFQQFSSSIMAKGFEDTFLYNYNRFVSLNEVGGDPRKIGIPIDKFHNFNKERIDKWPHSMNATSTHDTKRGEDVRARLNVLSELPQIWQSKVNDWFRINKHKKRKVKGKYAPDKNDEYFLYQTLIGAFPFYEDEIDSFKQRLKDYIIKAVREAKVHSTWIEPNIEYENACADFIDEILDTQQENEFFNKFSTFQGKISHFGIFNSLSQTLIKITSPGVPDFYQGSELWNLNLVDPDNRRPVDYDRREQLLNEIQTKSAKDNLGLIKELLSTKKDGRIKLFLTWKALSIRKSLSDLFQKGVYRPLEVHGPFKNQIIAFARICKKQYSITVVPRFLTKIISDGQNPIGKKMWKETAVILPFDTSSLLIDCFTESRIKARPHILVADVLNRFPVSFMTNADR